MGRDNHKLFVFFICWLSIDFLYNAVIGVLDYTEILGQNNRRIFDINSYHPEVALTISAISFMSFVFAFPVCFIQVTNAVKNTTTHERFSYNNKKSQHSAKTNSSQTSMPSMTLIRTSEEQGLTEFTTNAPSLYVKPKKNYCCGSNDLTHEMLGPNR